jgi:tRNA dimethylallyltransferase
MKLELSIFTTIARTGGASYGGFSELRSAAGLTGSDGDKQMNYVAIYGPTGAGKSALGRTLAEELGGEIVGCDSVQVYRGFDIGSAKEAAEVRLRIPHHLVDMVGWEDSYDAACYRRDASLAICDIISRGKVPILVGGTGLYLAALAGKNFHDLPSDPAVRNAISLMALDQIRQELIERDPERAAALHPNDRYRQSRALELARLTDRPLAEIKRTATEGMPPMVSIYICPERHELHQRIESRTRQMLGQGLVSEVEGLLNGGCPESAKPMLSIGYAQVVQHLNGNIPSAELAIQIIYATRQYAKRQCTWFGKMASDISMLRWDERGDIVDEVRGRLKL